MKNDKRKITIKTDIRLKVFRNIRKTLKYYFKNIFYIIFINTFLLSSYNYLFKQAYYGFLRENLQSTSVFNIMYFVIPIIFLVIIKIILYGNTTYIMKIGGTNDIKDLFSLVIKRFLPTLGTFIIFIFSVVLFSIFFIIPGIMYFFYYYFSVFLTSVGDINDKDRHELKTINGLKSLGRSYILVKNNLIRFSFLTIIIFILTLAFDKLFLAIIINLKFNLEGDFLNIARFCIFDMFIIYSSLAFIKFEGIENDVAEERSNKNQEEEVMLRRAAVNKFGKSKK